ncbi:MAG: hypothetical protein ACMXYD_03335 [Candidatus Woesearchaeota archaeon]
MYGKKRYGESKVERCPFCEKQAYSKNEQGFVVCTDHKNAVMNEMLCACGNILEVHEGKWGAFFVCMDCGAQNRKRVFSQNLVYDVTDA